MLRQNDIYQRLWWPNIHFPYEAILDVFAKYGVITTSLAAPDPTTQKEGLGKLNTKKRGATRMWVAPIRSLNSKLIENNEAFDIHFKGFMLLLIIVALA